MKTSRGSIPSTRNRKPTTRAEQIRLRQEERRLAEARSLRKTRNTRWSMLGGMGVIGVVVTVLIVRAVTSASSGASSGASSDQIPGVVTYSNLPHYHTTGKVTYFQNPPAGGPHNPVWLNCGIYIAPVPNENAVHSLEHGAVWITYQPTLPSTQVAHLHVLVSGHSYIILSPYDGLPVPVVATAWGVQLKVTSANDPRLPQFISKYEQGPQAPERGSPCSGGVGSPSGS